MTLTDTQTETFIALGVIGRILAFKGVECPDCHAQPGQTCHTNGRDRGVRYHANRKRAALDAAAATTCGCTAEIPCLDHVDARAAADLARAPVHFDL